MEGVVGAGGDFGRNSCAEWASCRWSIVEVIGGNAGGGSRSIRTISPGSVDSRTGFASRRSISADVVIASHTREGIVGSVAGQIGSIVDCTIGAGDSVQEKVGVTTPGLQSGTIVLAGQPAYSMSGAGDAAVVGSEVVGSIETGGANGFGCACQAGSRTAVASSISCVQVIAAVATCTVETSRPIFFTP